MKLHLPTRLRAAVLACFAVVTSFTTTFATGALTGGAFAVAIAGSQALAAYDATEAIYSGTGNTNINFENVPAGKTLTFAMSQDNSQRNYFSNANLTYNGDIIINGGSDGTTGLIINDGYKGKVITFAGAVTGNGVIKKTYKGTNITFAFTGDATDFTGKMDMAGDGNGNHYKLKFSTTNNSSSTKGVSGTGDITFQGTTDSLVYDYSGGNTVYVTNAITVDNDASSKVVLSGTDEVVFTKNVTIHQLFGIVGNDADPTGSANASKITFKGASSTLGKSNVTNTITSALEVAEGANLTLAGTMCFASLGDTARVTGAGSVSIADGFTMELGADFTPELKEYKVFGENLTLTGWEELTASSLLKSGQTMNRSRIEITATGFKFTEIGAEYTDMTTTGTQNWNYTDTIWTTGQNDSDDPIAFAAGDSAVFSSDVDLTLTATEIVADAVTVNGGANLTLTGNGNKLNCADITLNGNLVLKDNVLANTSRVSGTGPMSIAGEVLFDESHRFSSYTGDIIVQNGGILKVGSSVGGNGGVLGEDLFANSASTRTITVQQGGTIDLNGSADFYYALVLANDSVLKNSGSGVGTGSRSLPKTTLTGDAEITTGSRLGMLGSNYSKTTLNLGGHKLTKKGDGTFHLLNTDVSAGTLQVDAGVIEILYHDQAYEGKLNNVTFSQGTGYSFTTLADTIMENTQIKSDGTSIIKLQRGGIKFTKGGTVSSLALQNAGTSLTIEQGASVSVTNVELAAPIVNKGTLSITGTLTVADLAGFTPTVSTGTLSYEDADGNSAVSGYLTGERVYTLIENTGELNDSTITTVAGVEGEYENGQLTVDTLDDTIFYVNVDPATGKPDVVTAVDLGSTADNVARRYHINGGTLEVGTDGNNILATATGTTGIIKLTADAQVSSNSEIPFSGDLQVVGTAERQTVLTLGGTVNAQACKSAKASIASCTSVTLDNGKLAYQAAPETVRNLTITNNGAAIQFKDYKDGPTIEDATVFAGTTTLGGVLTITADYKYAARFERLYGAGELVAGSAGEFSILGINSLSGFSGKLTFSKANGNTDIAVSTGTTAVNFKGISVTNAMTLDLNAEAATTMTEGLSFHNGATVITTASNGGSLETSLVVNEDRAENDRTYSVLRHAGSGLTVNEITLNDTARLQAEFDADALSIKAGRDTQLKVVQGHTLTVTSLSPIPGSDDSFLTIGGSGKVNLNGTGSVASLGIGTWGTSPIVDLNGTYSVGRLRMSEVSESKLNLNTGSTLNITGTTNDNSTNRSILLAHWGYASTLVQDGGTLNAAGAVMYTGWTGSGTYQAKSGTATLKGISFLAQEWGGNNYRGSFLLGDETSGSARINIGSEGIYGINSGAGGAEVTVKLGNGTLGATSDWTMGYAENTTGTNVELIGINGGTVIDTADTTSGSGGHTITIDSPLVGSGKLVKVGAGTLKLTATNTYSGGTTLNGGTLEVAAESALGSGTLGITGGTLDVTGNVTLGDTVSTTVSGGSLKASHADGWTLTGASVGGAAADADSTGKVTLKNSTITGNITGNGKLVLSGTTHATANATVSGATVSGITVMTADATKLTLDNTTISSAITNDGSLELSGTQNVTLAGTSVTSYSDVLNGYKTTTDTYALASGTTVTTAAGTTWQVNGETVTDSDLTDISFNGYNLIVQTGDSAGKVYYINSGSVEYKADAGCADASKLQLTGGKLVMSKELDTAVTTGGIAVTGSSTTLELNAELDAGKLSLDTDAATVLMGTGTLNLGTGTSLDSGISLGTETDARWTGTVKVAGTALTDADLSSLGVSGSTIELDDTDGSLKGGTYAAKVLLSNGSQLTLGANNAFNGGLDATAGSLSVVGKNSISTLTLADGADLGINLAGMGLSSLKDIGTDAILTVGTLNAATAGGAVNLKALAGNPLLLTMSDGQSITLADITTCNASLGLLIGSSTSNVLEVEDANGFTYTYTLTADDTTGHKLVTVTARLNAAGWVGDTADTWKSSDAVGGTDANWAGAVGGFYGFGSGTVNLDTAGVTTGDVIVSATTGTTAYTFEGGALSADTLAVNAGSLVLNNESVSTTASAQVSDSAGLTVNAGKKLTVGTDMAVLDTAELTNNGSIKVTGTLSVDKTATVTNNGTLEVGSINASGATIANSGTLTTGGGTIGKLTGEGSLSNSGTLTIESKEATKLGALANSGILNVGGDLMVKTAVTAGGTVNAANVTVDGDAAFTSLTTGKLKASSLTVKDATITTLDTDKLTVSDKGAVKVTSATTLSSLSNKGILEVTGDLTLTAPVTAGGTVKASNVTVNGDAAFTTLSTGKLKASSLTVKDAIITTLDTKQLTVLGGTVAVTNGATLTALTGTGTLDAADKVKLAQAVSGMVNVETPEIELATYGSSLGALTTDAVTMLEGSTLSTEKALLTVNAVNTLSGDTISLDVSESAYAALSKLADGRYTAGDYLLIDGAASVDMFTYANAEQLDSIIATGMNAGLTVNDGVLSLSISEITNENGEVVGMIWDTTGGNTIANNGYRIDTEAGFYKSLDYVKQVVVTDSVTFDLAADSVGDSVAGNASEPVAGLFIRNLSGGGELTIKGNTAAQDVATLMNTPGRKITAVALTADAATVNLGLPKGAEGYLVSDLSSTGPTLKSLSLVNRSAVNVNINTEVLGDTDVADYTRLSVKEGNILTTGMLSGTDEAEIGGVITVRKGGVYTGTYDEATLVAADGSNLRLRTGGRRSMSLVVNGGGQTTLDSAGQDGSMDFLRVGESPMARVMSVGSATLNLLNTTATDDGIRHSTITLTSDEGNYINKSVVTLSLGAAETARTLSTPGSPVVIDGPVDVTASSIVVNMLGDTVKNGVLEVNTGSDSNLTLARFVTGGNVEGNTVTLTGTPEMQALLNKYYTNARLDSKGAIKVDRVTDYYGSRMQLSDNARVGIGMADAALVKLNPQANRSEYTELAGVLDSLDAAVATGNRQAADELGAAVSGASVAALGAAVAGDVERQLTGIRNRTTTMGVDQTQVNENMPYFNAWINAEGDFRRLDEDGTAAGYELTSWGGTVGFDVDMTPRLTMGLAATAMYGDFTAKSADHAEGDLDTYYVTAFARYAANRWSHTFVATAGMADTSLKRTVTHANGSYSTEGDAEAISFGFLYELGYVVAMNESATACLQPVFNVMLAHSSLDGYSEEGRDAALRMGGVDMTTVTFGMGARAQAIMGTNLYNRSSLVEGRALLKVRTGDTEAEAENTLGAVPGAMGSVKAAEMGTIGAELGVGLTVPMGAAGGAIFADASLEVSSGYTNINGTVGYRINF
ncbi:MAG: autotransporter-associated beta strand repeat-containing protein [Akkermansia sp.]|nr:autotransporter-associated beta strand repeat-containing protein [Akkermansia sp.]